MELRQNYSLLLSESSSANLLEMLFQETPLDKQVQSQNLLPVAISKIKWILSFLLRRTFHGVSVNHGCPHT